MTRDPLRMRNDILAAAFLAGLLLVVLSPALARPGLLLSGVDMHVLASWESFTRRAFEFGSLPHWNPYAFSGYPALADIQTGVFYPPNLLLRWLPVTSFFVWVLALHVWVLGVGTYALCRQFGTGRWPALAAGVGIMLSSQVWGKVLAGHQVEIYGYAWFPLALALMARGIDQGRLLPHWGLVATLALQALSGYPQGSVYVYGFVGAYCLYCTVRPVPATDGISRLRPLVQCALLFALAGGVAAYQLLPTLRVIAEAGRTGGIDYDLATEVSFAPGDLVTLLYPFAQGFRHQLYDSSLFIGVTLVSFAPLAFTARRFRHAATFVGIMVVVSLALAFGHYLPAYRLHYLVLPQLRVPTRLLFFGALGLVVLAAMGLEALRREAVADPRRAGRLLPWVPAATVLPALVLVGWLWAGAAWASGSVLGSPIWLLALSATALLAFGATGRRRIEWLPVLLVAVVSTEGLVSASRFVQLDGPTGPSPLIVGTPDTRGRLLSVCENAVSASALLEWGVATPDGFGSITLDGYGRFVDLVNGGSGRAGSRMPRLSGSENLPPRLDLLALLNVSHVLACRRIDDSSLRLVQQADGLYLHEFLSTRPRAFLTCAERPFTLDQAAWWLENAEYDADGNLVPRVHVRWADDLGEDERVAKERMYGLTVVRQREGTTWQYEARRWDAATVRELVADPSVVDTQGINRAAGRLEGDDPTEPNDDQTSLLSGLSTCTTTGEVTVLERDRPDGVISVDVRSSTGGLLVLSEPYYPERHGWVDDRAVPVERVNLAFSAVRVPPGEHRVELRYSPTSFRTGLLLTMLTLVGFAIASRWSR